MENKKLAYYQFGRFQTSEQDFKEVIDKKDWISFGKNNDFPQELIRIYQTSTGIHQALCDTKAQMIAGNGWKYDDIASSLKARLFFDNRYSQDNLDTIAKKCGFDLAIFNGFFLNIVWDATGTNIAKIEHIPFERVRAEKCTDDDNSYNWYVSRDWTNVRKAENKPVLFPGFSQRLAQQEGDWNKSQILSVMVYSPGMDYYTLPSYHATIDSIKAMYEASVFELKSIQNGFSAGMIIVNKGEYTQEEQEELYNDIKAKYTGADSAGDVIFMFVPDEESVPVITPIDLQDTAERFINFKDSITEAIIQGHGATSQVAGREVAGKLGSSTEIQEQYDLFQKKVINPYQDLLNETFNNLASINGIEEVFYLNTYNYIGGDEEEGVPVQDDVEAQKRAELRASVGGIQALIQVAQQVAAGLIDKGSAQAILELVYGFSPEESRRLLGGVEEGSLPPDENIA